MDCYIDKDGNPHLTQKEFPTRRQERNIAAIVVLSLVIWFATPVFIAHFERGVAYNQLLVLITTHQVLKAKSMYLHDTLDMPRMGSSDIIDSQDFMITKELRRLRQEIRKLADKLGRDYIPGEAKTLLRIYALEEAI